jgi:hypothetical protein
VNTQTPKEDRMTLDQEVDRVLKQMSKMYVGSKEYQVAVDNLKVLCDARGVKSPRSLSTDVIVSAAANILGILLVLNYEQMHVITSKAISIAFKGSRG